MGFFMAHSMTWFALAIIWLVGSPEWTFTEPLTQAQGWHVVSEDLSMNHQQTPELVGANSTRIALVGRTASTVVPLDHEVINKIVKSFAAFATFPDSAPEPDQIFLNIEGIQSAHDGPVLDVYVNLSHGANPDEHLGQFAGSIAFYGVHEASLGDQANGGGRGINQVLDITPIIDHLYRSQELKLSNLQVNFISRDELNSVDQVTIDRVSIYRQKQ